MGVKANGLNGEAKSMAWSGNGSSGLNRAIVESIMEWERK